MRIVVCIDFKEETLETAYKKLMYVMDRLGDDIEGWESTDEAYDTHGDSVAAAEFQAARMRVFRENQAARMLQNICNREGKHGYGNTTDIWNALSEEVQDEIYKKLVGKNPADVGEG